MTTATMTHTSETKLVNDMGYHHTVSVKEMESGFNYEVWLDDIRVASQINPYTGQEIAEGIQEFFFNQNFYVRGN